MTNFKPVRNNVHVWIIRKGYYICSVCALQLSKDYLHNNIAENEYYKDCLDRLAEGLSCRKEDSN